MSATILYLYESIFLLLQKNTNKHKETSVKITYKMNHNATAARFNFRVVNALLRQFLQEFTYVHIAEFVRYVFLNNTVLCILKILQKN